MRWVGHVTCMGEMKMRIAYNTLVRNLKGRENLENLDINGTMIYNES
jgi:hypothetical protein